MQKIYFEKWIDLNHQLNELLSLSVDESINYKIESVGVRAVGSLIVKGEYNGNHKFDENIELDVLISEISILKLKILIILLKMEISKLRLK